MAFLSRVLRRLRRLFVPPPNPYQRKFSTPPPRELARIQRFALGDPPVVHKQFMLGLDVVKRGIPGDFVECGVCNGGSAAAISLALLPTSKRAWLYDSFAGLPEVKPIDGPDAGKFVGACLGSEEQVRAALAQVGFPAERTMIRKGWFHETFVPPLPEQVALLHIDADWYESVKLSLNTFYDRVADGGVILLDDFGHWEGCREAFYEFCAARQLKPLLERFGHTQAFWVKNRTHNRDFIGQWEIP